MSCKAWFYGCRAALSVAAADCVTRFPSLGRTDNRELKYLRRYKRAAVASSSGRQKSHWPSCHYLEEKSFVLCLPCHCLCQGSRDPTCPGWHRVLGRGMGFGHPVPHIPQPSSWPAPCPLPTTSSEGGAGAGLHPAETRAGPSRLGSFITV